MLRKIAGMVIAVSFLLVAGAPGPQSMAGEIPETGGISNVGTATPPVFIGAGGAGGPIGDDCWECEECTQSGSHYDYLEVDPEWNHWMNGSFVNMCGIAYSECLDAHTLCPPIIGGGGDQPLFEAAQLDALQRAVLEGDASSVRAALRALDRVAYLAPERGSVQVIGCGGRVIAHLPLGEALGNLLMPQAAQ